VCVCMYVGCVIAFETVFTCACIIRANVAHVIKSNQQQDQEAEVQRDGTSND